jgi:site-specific DNA-methyltransferase (adenine-specific)
MWDTIFADPPDNIGLKYDEYSDNLPEDEYCVWLRHCLYTFINTAKTVWFSFNVKWIKQVADYVDEICKCNGNYGTCAGGIRLIEDRFYVQYFTFGQHRNSDFGNNMRPCWRLRWKNAPLLPDAIRIESERQRMGDKRADPRGRVPGDVGKVEVDSMVDLADAGRNCVFDWPRVTGNSRQRRKWHRTQLHEGFVRQCLCMSTPKHGTVLDPFAGTGTALRVAIREGFSADAIETSVGYCEEIAAENGLVAQGTIPPTWTLTKTGELEELPLFGGVQDERTKS